MAVKIVGSVKSPRKNEEFLIHGFNDCPQMTQMATDAAFGSLKV